jgi:hypothetical protein
MAKIMDQRIEKEVIGENSLNRVTAVGSEVSAANIY